LTAVNALLDPQLIAARLSCMQDAARFAMHEGKLTMARMEVKNKMTERDASIDISYAISRRKDDKIKVRCGVCGNYRSLGGVACIEETQPLMAAREETLWLCLLCLRDRDATEAAIVRRYYPDINVRVAVRWVRHEQRDA